MKDGQPFDRPRAEELVDALPGFPLRPDPLGAVALAVFDGDGRLHREEGPDRGLGAGDPAAALQVLEGVEGDVDIQVRGPVREDAGDLGGRDAVGGELDTELREEALAHRGTRRVDEVDLA